MNEYYYIKIKSIEYDQPDKFLTDFGWSRIPYEISVFDDIDDAIDLKKEIQEVHKGYTVEIVRF